MDSDDLLSSIAFTTCSSSSSSSQQLPANWNNNQNYFSPSQPSDQDTCHESETSTGYLEDVFLSSSQFISKKRRLLLHSSLNLKWWDTSSNCSDEERIGDKTGSVKDGLILSSSSSDQSTHSSQPHLCCLTTVFSSGEGERRDRKRAMTTTMTKVVYPFDMVKPLGFGGGVTLDDINERILMPPTRPVRHPVGDYACRPLVSPEGPGLSGKEVVAYTRIHTQGRGTITIVRTRG